MLRRRKLGVLCALALGCLLALAAALATRASGALTIGARATSSASTTATGCQLASPKGNIKHVIYIQFDNTHFRRDRCHRERIAIRSPRSSIRGETPR